MLMWYVMPKRVLETWADGVVHFPTLFWVGFTHFPGTLKDSHTMTVPVVRAFHPTQPRSWLIDFWNLDVKWIFVAIPFGFLTTLLFYYDHVRLDYLTNDESTKLIRNAEC